MPALGNVGPRPGCLRGAFSSGKTGWLGRESGCGGGRGGEKVLPQGLDGARVSTAGAAPLHGGPTARAATGCTPSSPPPPTAAVASREELRRLLPGVAGRGWTRQAQGEGARVSGAGRRCLWAPSPERLVRGRAEGAVSSSPPGAPYELRPLPARHPEARARGLCHPLPRSNLAEAVASPAGLGREMAAERGASPLRRVSRSAGGGRVCTPEGPAAATASRTHERRTAQALRLPAFPGLTGSPAAKAGGAHVGCRALARRLRPGRIPSRSRSPGMWGCDCYSTFRRRVSALLLGLRLALSPAWPRGMPPGRSADVTAMLCTSPPTPLYTSSVCGAHLLRGKGACAAGRPDSS